MKLRMLFVTFVFGLALARAACAASEEQTLRELDAQWANAAAAKNLEKTVSFYAANAIVMPPNESAATSKEAVKKIWQDLITSPGLVISWRTTKVEVSRCGDIGYTSGTYGLTMNDASGKPVNDRGKYLEVWKKQDGKWKCIADIWNSNLPAAAPAEKTPAEKK